MALRIAPNKQQSLSMVAGATTKALRFFVCLCTGRYSLMYLYSSDLEVGKRDDRERKNSILPYR